MTLLQQACLFRVVIRRRVIRARDRSGTQNAQFVVVNFPVEFLSLLETHDLQQLVDVKDHSHQPKEFIFTVFLQIKFILIQINY